MRPTPDAGAMVRAEAKSPRFRTGVLVALPEISIVGQASGPSRDQLARN